jgi:hypothetical protein
MALIKNGQSSSAVEQEPAKIFLHKKVFLLCIFFFTFFSISKRHLLPAGHVKDMAAGIHTSSKCTKPQMCKSKDNQKYFSASVPFFCHISFFRRGLG